MYLTMYIILKYRKVPKVMSLVTFELAAFGARYFWVVVTFGEQKLLNKIIRLLFLHHATWTDEAWKNIFNALWHKQLLASLVVKCLTVITLWHCTEITWLYYLYNGLLIEKIYNYLYTCIIKKPLVSLLSGARYFRGAHYFQDLLAATKFWRYFRGVATFDPLSGGCYFWNFTLY